jgi:hypothetical protein
MDGGVLLNNIRLDGRTTAVTCIRIFGCPSFDIRVSSSTSQDSFGYGPLVSASTQSCECFCP